jgi:gamma-glutamyltranspeptidase/glutathione hydrolase
MVVAANPIAAQVGSDILKKGGNAIDAAIAVQLVLGLVEPNASGIGGGGFLVYYDAKNQQIRTYDGRETAPGAAKPNRFLDKDGKPLPFYDAVIGGKSVGVPGTIKMLEMAHKSHGKLLWRNLFQPAIKLSKTGFPIGPRLHLLLTKEEYLARQEPAKSYFYQPDGTAKPVGAILVNRPYGRVLRKISIFGADAFYKGEIAQDIVATVKKAKLPGDLTTKDLASYRAIERSPVCGVYRVYKVCSMGPPSSGGLTVLQILGMLEHFPLATLKPASTEALHLFAEAGRLAYADRGVYMADADFVPVPVNELIDPEYLKSRAGLIDRKRAMKEAQPGQIPVKNSFIWGKDDALEFPSTTHMAIVDRYGNAVSMTTSIEDNFGSRLMVRGFLLNNQLTDFSFSPTTPDGKPIANRVEPKKRPRSSMSPTIVFNRDGKLVLVAGSAGGSRIINYVAKVLVAVLDWKLDSQQAISLPNFGNRNGATELEAGTDIANLKPNLEALGHLVEIVEQASGSHTILVTEEGLIGGVDPRRDGAAKGE